MLANAPLMVVFLNELRHYFDELSRPDWERYLISFSKWVLGFTVIYAGTVNVIYYALLNRAVLNFSIFVFNALVISNVIMAFTCYVQARLFATNQLGKFGLTSIYVSLIRFCSLAFGWGLVSDGEHIVIFEIIASLLTLLLSWIVSSFNWRGVSWQSTIDYTKGFYDGLAISSYNVYSSILMLIGSLEIEAEHYLLFFASYRLTRPIINLGSLFPNIIVRDGANIYKIKQVCLYFAVVVLFCIFLNEAGYFRIALHVLAKNLSYDESAFNFLIIIGAMSWLNGILSGIFIRKHRSSRPLFFLVLASGCISILITYLTNSILASMLFFEVIISFFFLIKFRHV